MRVTHTRTYNATTFADPYKRCHKCKGWITGALDKSDGPLIVVPCEHDDGYDDVCPSWGPVDGCTCADAIARGVMAGPMHVVPPTTAEGAKP